MNDAQKGRHRTKRSTQGCVTCVQAKVKCSEDRPRCQRCSRLHKECNWPEPRIPLRERRKGHGSLKFRESLGPVQIQTVVACLPPNTPPDFEQHKIHSGRSIPPALSHRHTPSPSSVCYGPLEQDALYYYENVFSRLSPKTFLWSINAILLKYSSDTRLLMHLLLACSMSHIFQHHANQNMLQAAKRHFRHGTELLVANLRAQKIDHCRNMMAFWLLQLTYRTFWDQKACKAMRKLSASMVSYVQDHKLIQLLSGTNNESGKSSQLSPAEKSVLAKFLLFAAYEDLDSQYCNTGGYLSAIILTNPSVSDAVYTISQACHGRFFGSDYPAEELMDDIERSVPLELHLQANIALSNLQQICQHADPLIQQLDEIDNNLQTIERRYSTVFQLASTSTAEPSKLMITTFHIIAHFYAVVVCVVKAMVTLSQEESIVQRYSATKKRLLHHVVLMISHSQSPVPIWRNQWPIFIAAANAEDIIHSDWLAQKLGMNRYATLLCAERTSFPR